MEAIDADLLIRAYANGYFPMADPDIGNEIAWYAPDPRAILPLDNFHVSKNLRKTVKRKKFQVFYDRNFEGVMRACAKPSAGRETTWISEEIVALYVELFNRGLAHSVECYLDDKLVGGLYGVSLAGAFFGESMFHSVTDASKVALVHLVNKLSAGGYLLLDVQFTTEHLIKFGVVEIPADNYQEMLADALKVDAIW